MRYRRRLLLCALALLAPGLAAQGFRAKPVRVIVPFPPLVKDAAIEPQ